MFLYYFTNILLFAYCFFLSMEAGKAVWIWKTGLRDRVFASSLVTYTNSWAELTHVVLIVYAVGLLALYPKAATYYLPTLLPALYIGALMVIVRIISLIWLHRSKKNFPLLSWLYAISSLILLISLTSFFAFSLSNSLEKPLIICAVNFVLLHSLYYGALNLTYYPRQTEQQHTFARWTFLLAILLPIYVIITAVWQSDLPFIQNALRDFPLLVSIYMAMFGATLLLLRAKQYLLLFYVHIIQFLAMCTLYLAGTFPYILRPVITVFDTTDSRSYTILTYSLIAVTIFVVGSLWYLRQRSRK
jgi:cytochrome bd-type quinol oxidase subunit 2